MDASDTLPDAVILKTFFNLMQHMVILSTERIKRYGLGERVHSGDQSLG